MMHNVRVLDYLLRSDIELQSESFNNNSLNFVDRPRMTVMNPNENYDLSQY